jgi:hypothetical protein
MMDDKSQAQKQAGAWSPRKMLVPLVVALVTAASLTWLFWYLRNQVAATDITGQVSIYATLALLGAACSSLIGYRNPGGDDSPQWRHFWSVADLIWLLVALLGLGRILLPVSHLLRESHRAADESIEVFRRQELLFAIWKEKDRNCSTPGPLVAECIQLDRLERRFLTPGQPELMAHGLRMDIEAMCGKTCSASMVAVRAAATKVLADTEQARKSQEELERAYIDLRRPKETPPEDTIIWAYATMAALVFGIRRAMGANGCRDSPQHRSRSRNRDCRRGRGCGCG